ncbi:GNAT family N-acetyltransferase [Mycoplana dimorpha]|nr:GNAT family N-acetyltransferase [Mycoplana dimorpha]
MPNITGSPAVVDYDLGNLRYKTCFSKHADATEALDFAVTLAGADSSETTGPSLAVLRGFLVQPGHLPERQDAWYLDLFDRPSQHAMMAFHILADDANLVRRALENDELFEALGSVACIERLWVHSDLRGRKIALRLLREAQHVLSRKGLLAIIKAHPDGTPSTSDTLRLAAYYQSEISLRLRSVCEEKYPGWLVGAWETPKADPGDKPFP